MKHGGDLLSYEEFYDGTLIDYSSNINPLGIPSGLEKVLEDSLKSAKAYPDIQYRKLKEALSQYLKCKKENIVVGNGAVEVIDNFILLANRVMICTPSFLEYEERALVHMKEVIRISYDKDFRINIEKIKEIVQKGDLLILGNPNNPTGLRIDQETLVRVNEVIQAAEGYLLLDEAFFEFCPMDYDSIELFRETNYENLGIIRAATKFFALPGIRLGYGCTSAKLANKISRVQLPWSINTFAEGIAMRILKDENYIKKSKAYIEAQRQEITKELSKLPNIKIYPTHTNFMLIELLKWNQEEVFHFFLKRGIVLRKCSSFVGLDGQYIRIAIRSREDNEKLIEVFKQLGALDEIDYDNRTIQ